MNVCPKCGYEEPPIWKNRYWQLYQQYAYIGELESMEETKELAAILQKIGPAIKTFNKVTYTDGIYNYQLRKDGIVVRITKKYAISPDSMREPPKAKSRPPKPNQKTLTEVIPYV